MLRRVALAILTAVCGALCGALLAFPWTVRIAPAAALMLLPLLYAYRRNGAMTCAGLTVLFIAAQLLVGLRWAYGGAAAHLGAGEYVLSAAALLFVCIPYAVMGAAAAWLSKLRPAQWCVAIASLWTLCEFWRATSPLGEPYLQLGHALIDTPLIAVARIGGTEALTFLSVLGVGALFELSQRNWRLGTASALVCATALILNPLEPTDNTRAAHDGLPVAVFQLGPVADDTLRGYARALQVPTPSSGRGFAVWPESALVLSPGQTLDRVQSAVRARGVPLLAGGTVADAGGVHNAVVLFDRDGNVRGYYAKRHLVPFGEYTPLFARILLPAQLLSETPNFSAGTKPVTFRIDGREVGALICFESAFPALARDEVRNGATLLVSASNDAWFARPSGAWQVGQTARLTAFETGTPIVVAGTVGPSGAIDADGKWTGTLTVGARASTTFAVGPARATIYDAFGDAPALVAIALFGLLAASDRVRRGTVLKYSAERSRS